MAALEANSDRDKFDAGDGGDDDPLYPQKIQVFEEWLVRNGGRFPKLTMQKYDTEVRGVHAVEEIGDEEVIVEVPLSCLITVEMGKATDVGRAVLAAALEMDAPKHVFLMLFMLVDRLNPKSHFQPYYDILPPTLSNMPIFWNEEELALLQGSYLLEQIAERNVAIETDYRAIVDVFPSFLETATLEDFKWARMCVCSRNFGIVVDGLRTSAMVPYADMLNHYRPRETKWAYENTRKAFTITSLQPIGCGAQVYDSYGQKCNHRFLLNYGFAIENNKEVDGFCPNEVAFKFALPDPCKDELHDSKMALWIRDGNQTKLVRLCASDNDNFLFALSCLRVMCCNREELLLLNAAGRGAGGAGAGSSRDGGGGVGRQQHGGLVAPPHTVKDVMYPLSLRNERACMESLLEMVTDKLNLYPRTLAQDRELLEGGGEGSLGVSGGGVGGGGGVMVLPPFSNQRHAVIQVSGEKEVLLHYEQHCKLALRLMDWPLDDDGGLVQALRALELDGETSKSALKYVSADPRSVLGYCRREERKAQAYALPQQQQQQQLAGGQEGQS